MYSLIVFSQQSSGVGIIIIISNSWMKNIKTVWIPNFCIHIFFRIWALETKKLEFQILLYI